MLDQDRMWKETLGDDPDAEEEVQHGGHIPTEIDPQIIDIIPYGTGLAAHHVI